MNVTENADIWALAAANSIWGVVVYVIYVVALWRVFTKAGFPGWVAIIPFVNLYFHVKLGGFNGWLFLLLLIPIVNIVFGIILALRIGRAFGKGGVFSFFLLFLFQLIGFLILAFDSSQYTKPV